MNRTRLFAFRCLVFVFIGSLALVGCATSFKVVPTPADSDVTLDDQVTGHGVTTIKLNVKASNYKVGINPPAGYFPKDTLVTSNSPKILTLVADKDYPYYETVEANDIVNKWIVLEIASRYSEEDAWQKLVSTISSEISDFEVLDQKSLYLKSAWRIAGRHGDLLRSRSRIIVSGDNTDSSKVTLKVKVEADRINDRGDSVMTTGRTFASFLDAIETAKARLTK